MDKYSLIWNNFIKSFVWLILPLSITGSIYSCSNYIEAGTHLTSYSVSVSGYYRSNGSYVRPYNRRPSGGVRHDEPFENQRTLMGSLFFLSVMLGLGNIYYFYSNTSEAISAYKRRIIYAENQRILKEKENKKNLILARIKFNNNEFQHWPQNLFICESNKKCKHCNNFINKDELYISYTAIKYTYHVCINCLSKSGIIKCNRRSINYFTELRFVDRLNKGFENYVIEFNNENIQSTIKFSTTEMWHMFLKEIKKNCS